MIHRILARTTAALTALVAPVLALASEAGPELPWNQPLEVLRDNLSGPTGTVILLIALMIGLLIWAFADDSRGLMRAAKAVLALAVVTTVAGLVAALGINAATL